MAKTYHKRNQPVDGYSPVRSHPNYYVWSGMKSRCNSNHPNYGGRGITYCEQWEDFATFCMDMGVRPSPEHTIERINNEGNYEPSNCKWATQHEQSMNRRVFTNNTTGCRGVTLRKRDGRYIASVQYGNESYHVAGSFSTPEEAYQARCELVLKLKSGEDVSDITERKARYNSSVGIRGISKHKDGGYVVRKTINGTRKYIGYYKTLEQAERALNE